MDITVNGEKRSVEGGSAAELFGGAVVIKDGYQLDGECVIRGGDDLIVIERGVMPPRDMLERMMAARHSPGVHDAVKRARVTILGLGGLGSNVAVMLARLGVGSLTIVDCDTVEPSNLNRQCYYIRDLGRLKCDALAEELKAINPYIEVKPVCLRVDADNIMSVADGADIVVEAFDRAEAKAMAVNTLLTQASAAVVCSSGMAGIGEANKIQTRRSLKRLTVCGDGVSDSSIGIGLMSPRVTLCAAHQANAVLRLILGLEP